MAFAVGGLGLCVPWTASAEDIKAQCLTASDQGQQLRDDGKYKRAREQFQLCERDACPRIVSRLCTQWARDIDVNMPTLVVAVKDAHGADVLDAQATLDGEPLGPLDGKPVPVDPGVHVLRVTREGALPVQEKLVVRAAEKNREVTLTLVAATSKPPPKNGASEQEGPPPSTSTGRLVTTIVLGGAAAGGIGSAIYLGLHSSSEANTASSLRGSISSSACAGGSSQVCQNLGNAVDAQNRDAILSRVLYAVGGVLAAGAVTTFFVWPKAKTSSDAAAWVVPWGGSGSGGVALGGRFW
jgi:hypothetical protein